MLKRWGILLLVLVMAVGFWLLETNQALGKTISETEMTNPKAKKPSAAAIEFNFEILRPNKTTSVDGYSIFLYRLTNLSSSERIDPEDVSSAGVSFDPPLPMNYVDNTRFLIRYPRISLEPGESMIGLFFCFNWSDEVPVGYVQGGEMGINIGGGGQSVPYSVTITD